MERAWFSGGRAWLPAEGFAPKEFVTLVILSTTATQASPEGAPGNPLAAVPRPRQDTGASGGEGTRGLRSPDSLSPVLSCLHPSEAATLVPLALLPCLGP